MRTSSCRLGAVFLSQCKGSLCKNGIVWRKGRPISPCRALRFFSPPGIIPSLYYFNISARNHSINAGPQTRSRFTRQGSSRPAGNGTLLQGPDKYGVNPTSCTGQQFLSLLHRLRAEVKQQPSESRRRHVLFVLSHFSLKRVSNMDGRIVHQLLELLARLQASPDDNMLVQESVAWLTVYGSSSSTSAMLVTQCLRNLLHLDAKELVMPVLLGCQSTFAMLESQQRATDACVILLAAILHGLAYHDRRSTTSHQQLLPVLERLINQVTASSLEQASNTDLRLLLEAFATLYSNAPELFLQRDTENVSRRLVECMCHLRSVLAEERGEEFSGSLFLQEALQVIKCCDTIFPLSSLGDNASNAVPVLHEEEKKIESLVFRRAIELLESRNTEETISSAVILCLQEIILRYSVFQDDTASSDYFQKRRTLISLGSSCIEQYFSESGEASPDVAASILQLYWDHQNARNEHFSMKSEEIPTDSLSLLVVPPVLIPTGCAKMYDDLSSEKQQETQTNPLNTLLELPEYIARNIEGAWQKCIPQSLENNCETTISLPWSSSSVQTLLRYFEYTEKNGKSDAFLQSSQLRKYYFNRLQHIYNTAPTRIVPSDFSPFFMESASSEPYFPDVVKMVTSCMSNWSVNQVLHWLRISTAVPPSASIRKMMREGCKSLIPYMDRASSEQLVALMYYYGRAGVRQDDFCDAISKRLGKLCEEIVGRTNEEDNNGLVSVVGLSIILSGFAAVEYRSTKPFLDSSSVITQALQNYASNKSAEQVETARSAIPSSSLLPRPTSIFAMSPIVLAETGTVLLAAYAKMLVWNFKVIWSLADFLATLCDAMTLRQLLVTQLALQRMDVHHPPLTAAFMSRLKLWSENADQRDIEVCPNSVVVVLLSVWSRVSSNKTVALASVSEEKTNDSEGQHAVIQEVFEIIIRERLTTFTPLENAEILLSLARVGMSLASTPGENKEPLLFDHITSQLINTLPTAPPQALCHMVNAYALAGRSHPELFSLIAQRVIKKKNDIPAVIIASILSAFASTGNDDAVLFMEMIPRVRFVAQFGTPRDVTNVVCAYATVKVWHYKLFSRLADRAIQLRSEFSPVHLVRLLQAYGSVGMRYDSLFTEMSSRIQAVVHLMSPKELGLLLESYATVHMHCPPVFESCANQGLSIADLFSLEEAELILSSLEAVGHLHPALWLALHNRFPEQLRNKYLGVQQRQHVQPDAAEEKE